MDDVLREWTVAVKAELGIDLEVDRGSLNWRQTDTWSACRPVPSQPSPASSP
ncbi:hypothetical protein [Streptomyces sp. bgisy022]|uniref:hypothetical protein n=1 Tax=Streptomyces sp. bgisy022 TaxID=3413769 RepID=UPI003D760B04